MKKVILFCIGLLVGTPILADTDIQWFLARDYSTRFDTQVIGYGVGADLDQAILNAKVDISNQIKSTVTSSLTIKKDRVNENYNSSVNHIQNEKSEIILSGDTEVLLQAINQDKWYVAVLYDNASGVMQFAHKLPVKYHFIKYEHNETQNQYFTETIIGKELNRILPRKIDARLSWKDNSFFLIHGDVSNRLNEEEYSIPDLFITYSNSPANTMKIVKGSTTNGIIISDEDCQFKFNSTSGKKYVSLFAVNPEGVVLVLENNIPITKDSKGGKGGKDGKDVKQTTPYQFFKKNESERSVMFVSVFSDQTIDNSYFRVMQGNEERASYGESRNGKVKFDRFIDFLNGKEFVAQKMLIK